MGDPLNQTGTIVTGVIGDDVHNIGIKVIEHALKHDGYKVVSLGIRIPDEEFVEAAVETRADAIFVSSLSGHARALATTLRDKCTEAGLSNILLYIGDRHGLAPESESGRLWAHQLQLTIADIVQETHDTHHPISTNLYYEDQKPEARRRAQDFVRTRLPKYLGYFERVLARSKKSATYLAGPQLTYADLSLFQLVAGLRYAFPRAMTRVERQCRHVAALHDRVAARPRIAAYLSSGRRLPFSEEGIFRHYKELDL